MALGDFFRINMPYGLQRNDKDEWFAFNREYKPLGWNTNQHIDEKEYPVYTKYKGLTEARILKITESIKDGVLRDSKGKIYKFWLYDDATNPKNRPKYWNSYFLKIRLLSNLSDANDFDLNK